MTYVLSAFAKTMKSMLLLGGEKDAISNLPLESGVTSDCITCGMQWLSTTPVRLLPVLNAHPHHRLRARGPAQVKQEIQIHVYYRPVRKKLYSPGR